MGRLAPLLVLIASTASAQTMYRWVDKQGNLHYTDDLTTIPKGAKVQETEGAELTISNVAPEEPSKGKKKAKQAPEPELNDERAWRRHFGELRQKLAKLKASIEKDRQTTADTSELADMAFGPDQSVEAAKARIGRSEDEVRRLEAELEHLNAVADQLKIPKAWRE